jgi:Inosine-uridine preferring nucleoside hydrolase
MCGGLGRSCAIYRVLLILLAGSLFAISLPYRAQANPRLECVIIDTDADLDDIRAIAALVGSKQVIAIVTTEGIARSKEGASAVEHFLQRIGANIPVIPGELPNPERDYHPDPDLPKWRDAAEHLNGTFPNLSQRPEDAPGSIATALISLVKKRSDCHHLELLIIGPWTSFMRYGPELLDRVDLIVAQGRPEPDELEGQPAGFNCRYDLNSCLSAYDLLVGRRLRMDRHLQANWVDIPQSPVSCGSAEPGVDAEGAKVHPFRPTLEWAGQLHEAGGAAAAVSEILVKNPASWSGTSLWDDLAALYLLRPDLFAPRGGHLEPCVSAETVRHLLTAYMAGKT